MRIAVAAYGVCGTDREFVAGHFPGMIWPLTLGHEIAGTIAELGAGIDAYQVGDRVAVLRRVGDGPRQRARPDSRRTVVRRSRPDGLRRRDLVITT